MKKHTTITIAFIFLAITSIAQTTLKGKVTDKASGKALEAVSIFIPEYQKSVNTNADGTFSIDGLGKGIVHIQSTIIGYKSNVQTADLSAPTDVSIALEASATELEEVLVTSNSSKLPDNIPFSANSLSQMEAKKYSSQSVVGNLSYQPGIDKISIGNGIAKPVIRGLSFNQIMLYGQGTRIENQQWDDHHDLGLTDVGVDKVEIVRGPAALIYGADAMGGALIFVDEKPAPAGKTIGDINAGGCSNTLGVNSNAGVRTTGNNGIFFGLRAGINNQVSYVMGTKQGEILKLGERKHYAYNSKFGSAVVKANVGMSKKWGVSKFSYMFQNQKTGVVEDEAADTLKTPGADEVGQHKRGYEAPLQDVNTHIFSLENTILTGKSKLNINIAQQTNHRAEHEPNGLGHEGVIAIGLLLNTTTFDTKWTSNPEKDLGFTVGAQGTFLKNENFGLISLVPDATVNDLAGYGLLRYDHDKLNLLAGARYDLRHIRASEYAKAATMEVDTFILHSTGDTLHAPETKFSKDYTPVSFSVGAAYHLSEGFTIKLNGATGFSAPNYAQLGTFGKHEGTYRFERGNNKLNVEQNTEGDLGFIWENEFITLSAGGYINMIKDYIYIESTNDTMIRISESSGREEFTLYDYKQNSATITGGEFGFDIHPAKAKWIDLKGTYAMIQGTLDKGGNLPYIPSNKMIGEIKLSMEKIGPLENPYLTFVVSNYSTQSNLSAYEKADAVAAIAKATLNGKKLDFNGYTLLDAHIGTSFNNGKSKAWFEIYCTNILNTAYCSQLSLVKYIGIRDMGRNIGVSLHLPFGS